MKFIITTFVLFALACQAKKARVIHLGNDEMETVHLYGGKATALNFPTKPEKVICGNKSLFSIEFVENDIVITPLLSNANSNLFVYLFGRRFGFTLSTSGKDPDEIVIVRDRPLKNEKKSKTNKSY